MTNFLYVYETEDWMETCPRCNSVYLMNPRLMIIHLNDEHRLSFTEIAEALDQLPPIYLGSNYDVEALQRSVERMQENGRKAESGPAYSNHSYNHGVMYGHHQSAWIMADDVWKDLQVSHFSIAYKIAPIKYYPLEEAEKPKPLPKIDFLPKWTSTKKFVSEQSMSTRQTQLYQEIISSVKLERPVSDISSL